MPSEIESIADIANCARSKQDFALGWRNFLDGFYAEPDRAKLSEEPQMLGAYLEDGGYADAFLAGVAEYLAHEYHFEVPAWCRDQRRVLSLPTFAFETPEGRMFLLAESPTAFRSRNIFVSADALSRV